MFDLACLGVLLSMCLPLMLAKHGALSIAMQDHNDLNYRDLMLALEVSVVARGQMRYMSLPS